MVSIFRSLWKGRFLRSINYVPQYFILEVILAGYNNLLFYFLFLYIFYSASEAVVKYFSVFVICNMFFPFIVNIYLYKFNLI